MTSLRPPPSVKKLWRAESLGVICLVLLAGGAAGVVVLPAILPPRVDSQPERDPTGLVARGLRTTMYDGNRPRARIVADSVRVFRPRAFGPFRFGFLRTLSVSNLIIETFGQNEGSELSPAERTGFADAWKALAPDHLRGRIATAEAGPLTWRRNRGNGSLVLLEAEWCSGPREGSVLVCEDGWILDGTDRRHFHNARYDGHRWDTGQER